jgi:hypothetical protein
VVLAVIAGWTGLKFADKAQQTIDGWRLAKRNRAAFTIADRRRRLSSVSK